MGQSLVTFIMIGAFRALTHAAAVPRQLPPAACITHLTSLVFGYQGDFEFLIAKTVYTNTVVKTKMVPCGGCELDIDTAFSPFGGGPSAIEIITSSVTATQPLIITTTLCSPSKHLGSQSPVQTPAPGPAVPTFTVPALAVTKRANNLDKRQLIPFGPVKNGSDGKPAPDCTYTQLQPLSMIHGPIRTMWTATTTITSHVDCAGCKFVEPYTINGLNHGPVAFFHTTTTAAAPSRTTVFACLKSPSVIIGRPAPSSALHHTKLRRKPSDSVNETKASTPKLS